MRTDSIFSFTAFRDVGGVGVKKNRQAFHIASIDDNGVIDPSPAAVEFVATIDKLPEIRFSVRYLDDNLNLVSRKPYSNRAVLGLAPEDTIGMYRPFGLSYHGLTTNGLVRGYRWRPQSADWMAEQLGS